jgi:hypothetical protein
LPELAAIQKELGDQVTVVGLQTHGTLQRGAQVLQEAGASYASVSDPGLAERFGVQLIPYTVLVRSDGRLGVAIAGGGTRELFREQALALASR